MLKLISRKGNINYEAGRGGALFSFFDIDCIFLEWKKTVQVDRKTRMSSIICMFVFVWYVFSAFNILL